MNLILCGGTQSSGSTLVSWCFLQRGDTDGVLDARFDVIPHRLPRVGVRYTWCKMTVACFGLSEAVGHFGDEGWDVKPILVVRDVRVALNSLISKEYGRNGTTADDPPLRLRMRRFLADFRLAREEGWPLLRFESLLDEPEETLRRACAELGLPWDDGMVRWPKQPGEIADGRHGNETFVASRNGQLLSSIRRREEVRLSRLRGSDLDWLEESFGEYNRTLGYPERWPRDEIMPGRLEPSFEVTRRAWRERKRGVLSLFRSVGRGRS